MRIATASWKPLLSVFLRLFGVAGIAALMAFFGTAFVMPERHGILLLIVASALWFYAAWIASSGRPLAYLLAVSAGLTWGFLVALSIAVGIQNGRLSVNWPAMIPGILLIPFAGLLTVLPFWFLSKRRRKAT